MASHHRRQSSLEDVLDFSGQPLPSASPLQHRHQSSFEGIINFSAPEPLPADQRSRAQHRFYSIINHFGDSGGKRGEYSRPLLVRYTYEFSRSELSKDTFLRAFFNFMQLDIASEGDIDFDDQLLQNLIAFADLLLDNFYLPLKASSKQTPQPSPAHLSAIQRAQGGVHSYAGTPERLSHLRGSCLIRDHHRCVVSRKFDSQETLNRTQQHGDDARDDEGNPVQGQARSFLEVAHILPHSLTHTNANSELDDSKKTALAILNMFDCDVSHIIDGTSIDRPFNAITLTQEIHRLFGDFKIYFEPVDGQEHTYRIDSFLPAFYADELKLPVVRKLFIREDRLIDAPSPRLLAIHRAIAHILRLSGAGEYIDKILREFEETGVQSDGSTDLGRIVNLRYGGWLDGAVDVH
ncbi:hypothetical protein PRK78_004669 [Emydomyces testavorans]|uniref:HNH nuclease domain-containing protein n=1 Tax=Emydomyces testavorans TaxID=2070801 RepID=A0AAF0IIT7_9EURO|nr:hypothetical protein PRK78_004669 [Emydomyces testavorans]